MSTPMRRIRSPCCARAASGHAAAPPRSVINARLFMAMPRLAAAPPTPSRQEVPAPVCTTLEGLGHQYDPEFRLIERVKPFIDRAMRERYQPVETARRAQQTLSELFGVVTSMPGDLARLVKDARHGRMRVDLDLKRLDRFGERLHSAMDRATIGIMTASLVVGSSIVMTIGEGPRVFGVSLLTYCGLVGYLVAFVNSLWIILSIWRSRRR